MNDKKEDTESVYMNILEFAFSLFVFILIYMFFDGDPDIYDLLRDKIKASLK